jgi:uncharacterized NAD-dependent epimerase/dehydratase family protein
MPVLASDIDRLPSLRTDAMSMTLPTSPVVAITTCKTGKTEARSQVQQSMQTGKNVLGEFHTKLTKQTETKMKLLSTHTHLTESRHFLDVSVFCSVHSQRTAGVK